MSAPSPSNPDGGRSCPGPGSSHSHSPEPRAAKNDAPGSGQPSAIGIGLAEVKTQPDANGVRPATPEALPPFDWDEFEARYQKAIGEADEREKEILKEAEGLARVGLWLIWQVCGCKPSG